MSFVEEILSFEPGHAIFDMDGTLIHGDISEATLRYIFARKDRPLSPIVRAALGTTDDLYRRFEEICAEDFCYGGNLAAQALAGWHISEVEALIDHCFEVGDVRFRTEVVDLAQQLATRHTVWILTGSADVFGRAIGRRLGIDHVVGLGLKMEGDYFTDTLIPPCTCGKGKVEAAQNLISSQPVFSIGDSPTDLPLLRIARVARTLGRIANREFPAFPS